MRTLIYCRVSHRKIDSQSFSNQEKICMDYCKENKLNVYQVHKEFNSGYGKQKTLIDIIRFKRNINLVLADTTRLSRSKVLGRNIVDNCLKRNIHLHFVKEKIVLSDRQAYNDLIQKLNDSENEWHNIRNRIVNNIAYRRRNCLLLGNVPYGFNSVDKKLEKNNDFNTIRLIIHLRNGNKDVSFIRNILKELTNEYETLNFYDEKGNVINEFSKGFHLDFSDITIILNDYNISSKVWTTTRVKELYFKYCNDSEFKVNNIKKNNNDTMEDYNMDVELLTHFMNKKLI